MRGAAHPVGETAKLRAGCWLSGECAERPRRGTRLVASVAVQATWQGRCRVGRSRRVNGLRGFSGVSRRTRSCLPFSRLKPGRSNPCAELLVALRLPGTIGSEYREAGVALEGLAAAE